ncbi:MAG TPA: FAD-dependent oxidoreductase [Clostridia bacterium]|nr:FAD-dependent oxidoreductase [Clostridia bacterium]
MKNHIFKAALITVIIILTYQFGIKPWFNYFGDKKNALPDGKITHEAGKYDVIVAGEDPEGIAAVLSSSRLGAKTLLIAQGKDLGGIVSECMIVDFENNYDNNGNIVNKGILSEFKKKLGANFSVEGYITGMKKLTENKKNIDIVYNARIESAILESNSIKGVRISAGGKESTYYGKRFIDATRDGAILKACGDPYFTGSEDLNLKNTYMAARLNFELENANWSQVQSLTSNKKFLELMGKYQGSNINIRLNNIRFFVNGLNGVIVQGLEVINLDESDGEAVRKAYNEAKNEVKNLIVFLKAQFKKEFKSVNSYSIAKSFYFREKDHFIGERTLEVNDILENRDCEDKIALGAYPVEIGKFTNSFVSIAGKPNSYAIPLGCIIPLKTDNLLMAGRKISYSSIASSSAGSMSVNVTTGESAGVVGVYSLVKDITPRDILKQENERIIELEDLLKQEGVYLPGIKAEKKQSSNWSYPAVRQLNTLGLLEGGVDNDYEFSRTAVQKDMATLLINGIYRLSAGKYSIDLSVRLSPYMTNQRITPEISGEIVLALYNASAGKGQAFGKACRLGYIDKVSQLQMAKKKFLTMDDIYNLCANNLRRYTGKSIKD